MRPTDPGGLPLPGTCKSCGSATKKEYLDTGTQENEYGAILYCIECLTHYVSLFGFLPPENVSEIKRLAEEQFLLNVALNVQREKLIGAIDGLVRSGYRNDSIDFIELDLVHLDSLVNCDPREREEPVDSGTIESVEQSPVERVDDVRTDGAQFRLFN